MPPAALSPRLSHRPMRLADLDRVMAIEAQAYSHPWTRGNLVDSVLAGYLTELRLDAMDRLLGYWVAMPGVDETHLLNLTIAPGHQRAGHGRQLLRRLVQQVQARGDQNLWLEVRQSNAAARALYRAEGFDEISLRRGYYPAHHGREDAVVMRLPLPRPGQAETLDALD